MSKKLLLIGIIILVIFVGISIYLITTNQKNHSSERTVSWNESIEILNNGKVKGVFQSHSLNVILTLKDGTNIITKEPGIDNIFDEVEKCGNPCNMIVLGTE